MSGSTSTSERVGHASLWAIAGKFVARGIDFISLLILARLLNAQDFGLVAIAITVLQIVEAVLELPVYQVLVRVPHPTEAMFSTAFTLALLRGVAIAIVMSALAWPLSHVYGDRRLVLLTVVLSLAPIFRGLASSKLVLFLREFDFRPSFALDVSGKLAALAVAAILAITTRSYWAIAAGTVASPIFAMILSFVFAPVRPRLTLEEWPRFKDTVGWNSLSQLIMAFNWQIDRLLLPRFVDLTLFGRYTMAHNLASLPQQALVQPIGGPLLTAFARPQANEDLQAAYLKASNAIFCVVAPVALCMFILAEPLLRIGLGAKWVLAASMLQWVILSALVAIPSTPMVPLALALDRTRFAAVRLTIEFCCKVPALLIALIYCGIGGVLIANVVVSAATAVGAMFIVRRLISLSLWDQFFALWRTVASGAFILVFSFFWKATIGGWDLNNDLILPITIISAVVLFAVYWGFIFLLWKLSNRPSGAEELIIKTAMKLVATGSALLRRVLVRF